MADGGNTVWGGREETEGAVRWIWIRILDEFKLVELGELVVTRRQRWSTPWKMFWVTVHASIRNERRPVQPHKVETRHNRLSVWDIMATDWAGDEDWMSKRENSYALGDKTNFVTFALDSMKHSTVHKRKRERKESRWEGTKGMDRPCSCVVKARWQESESMVSILWDWSAGEKLAKFRNTVLMVEKEKSQIPSRRLMITWNTFSGKTIRKLIIGPTWGLRDRKNYCWLEWHYRDMEGGERLLGWQLQGQR